MVLPYWMLSLKPAFPLFFQPHQEALSSSSLSAFKVVSSTYLRLLILILGVLILACDSSSLAFRMRYSAYNKQGDNMQPWCTPFPILNQSVVPCPILTIASWPAYGFHRRQVRWSGIPISLRIFHNLLSSTQSKALVQFSSVTQSCPILCDPMNRSKPGLPVHHQLPEFTQTHVHRVGDAIQPSHPLSSPFPPAPNPSQHQSLFQWVNSSHDVAKVLEFQL